MITAVRLRPYARKGANRMRTYTSVSGKKYEAGFAGGDPSPIYAIDSTAELREFEAIAQFQIMHFDSVEELHEFVQHEMEIIARRGGHAVRARMVGFPDAPKATQAVVQPMPEPMPEPKPVKPRPKPRPAAEKILAPTSIEDAPKDAPEPAKADEPDPEEGSEPEKAPKPRRPKPRVRKTPKRKS